MRAVPRLGRVGTFGICLVILSCRSHDESSARADSARAAPQRGTVAPSAADTAASEPEASDANIFALLDEASAADSSAGAMAARKATDGAVRRFAIVMMSDHHALRVAAASLATVLSVSAAPQAGDRMLGQAAQSKALLGTMPASPAWDLAYLDREVTFHTMLLETLNRSLVSTRDRRLKELIEATAPTLQTHLAHAKELAARLK